MNKNKYEVSVYYFPNYHKGDSHNNVWHGENWSEWELMKNAKPRFEGHKLPAKPLWGYEDESNIDVMNKKMKTAKEYGVTNMIFDWYWYKDGPFLNKPLDQAFLKCDEAKNIKFSIMWANHDWVDIHPVSRTNVSSPTMGLEWKISEQEFFKAIDFMIANYFNQPNYFKLDGDIFLSIYEVNKLIQNFGGVDKTKDVLEEIRLRVQKAGLGKIHINAIVWGSRILMGESGKSAGGKVLKDLGFDSVSSYVWIHEHWPETYPTTDYKGYRELCDNDFERLTEEFHGIDYYPNVTAGWDSSPRTVQSDEFGDLGYPFSRVLANNTPKEFEKALQSVKKKLDNSNLKTKMFTINAWNEWSEGSYIEPCEEYGYARLEAIKNTFGKGE